VAVGVAFMQIEIAKKSCAEVAVEIGRCRWIFSHRAVRATSHAAFTFSTSGTPHECYFNTAKIAAFGVALP